MPWDILHSLWMRFPLLQPKLWADNYLSVAGGSSPSYPSCPSFQSFWVYRAWLVLSICSQSALQLHREHVFLYLITNQSLLWMTFLVAYVLVWWLSTTITDIFGMWNKKGDTCPENLLRSCLNSKRLQISFTSQATSHTPVWISLN